jgi:hypothetical protein
VGLVALAGLSVPGRSLVAPTTPAELVTGAAVLDLSSLAVAGGLLVVGVGALAFGLVLLLARVA